jgi:IclR family acetate operon transcriptional repressor
MAEKSKAAVAKTPRRRQPQWAKVESSASAAPEAGDDRYYSRTIERAFDALEAFRSSAATLSLKELSAVTKQPESSLYRVLTTLQKRGYLHQNHDGTYQLTRKVLYGRTFDQTEDLRVIARPFLEELGQQFDETASLAYLFSDYIQVLDTVETFHPIRVTNRPGRIIPPHCSSMGKVILAYQDNNVADRLLETYGLVRRTEHTITDRQALRRELAQVRNEGFACDREESMLGGICFGAPIFSSPSQVVAALSVSTPKQRMDSQREKAIQKAVILSAQKVSDLVSKALLRNR